ncbi:MAG: ribbon-helix-helix domain-containing protein [Candidatus Nanohaloarchaea archaeon]
MATVSVRLSDRLNEKLDEMVEKGVFKDRTDAFHEAVRLLMLRYDDFEP